VNELDQLARAGDALDGQADQAAAIDSGQAAPGAPGAPAAPAVDPNVAPIAFLLSTFRELASAILAVESLRVTLDAPKVDAIAGALAPVATKYGLNLATAFTGPEAQALTVAGPLLWVAAVQLSHELKAKKAKPVAAEPADQAAA
jgi:hypothetical protein